MESLVDGTGHELTLKDLTTAQDIVFTPQRLVIAGLTGRHESENQRHIHEMKAAGIRLESSSPVFFDLPASLVQQTDVLVVPSLESSGEVEPVLFCTPAGWFVGVGSDHTARDMARESVVGGKTACCKPVGRDVIPAGLMIENWDQFELHSSVEGKDYQKSSLGEMQPLNEIVDAYQLESKSSTDGLVMFLGTVPMLSGELRYGQDFLARIAGGGITLSCRYDVRVSQSSVSTLPEPPAPA
ncbi:MAG: DUF2848 family protein [Acidimicrobiia bacterium]